MRQVGKKVLIALSAPAGFVLVCVSLYYGIRLIVSFAKLPVANPTLNLTLFIIIFPFSAMLGSYLGLRFIKRWLKIEVSFMRLAIGSVAGYVFGILLETVLFIRGNVLMFKSMVYPCLVVVLLCGYIGALIGIESAKIRIES